MRDLYCQACNQNKATFIRVLPPGSGSEIQLLCTDCVSKLSKDSVNTENEARKHE